MALKLRTFFSALLIAFFAFFAISLFSIYWVTVFVTLFFLFIGSMFFFVYLDFNDLKIPKMKKWPTVTVIIPCYNASSTIVQCVESVKNLSYQSKPEIIVVNDASTDGSLQLLKKMKGIKIIDKTKNAGKAAAINSALRVAKGELVCCIDADTFPSTDALEKTVPFFSDKKVGAVTCLIRVHEPDNFFKVVQELEYLVGFAFYQTMLSQIGAAMITPGPMCVYRKKALQDVGGYDETNITEDMEIALRLQKNFYKIKASYLAVVFTVVPTTLRQWVKQRIRWYRGKVFNTAKYRELLFNPSYGFLGNFSLPFTFLIEMSSVFILFLIGVLFLQSALFGLNVFLSGLNVNFVVPLEFPPLVIHSSAVFFSVVTFSTFGLALFAAFGIAKEKFGLKYVLPVIFIVFFYGLLVASMWLTSLFKEINRSEYSW